MNKVIDLKLGAQLIAGDEDLAKEMIVMMINSFPEELIKLKKAYEGPNWNIILDITHKLHGGASYCGTPRLKKACARLEDCLISDQKEHSDYLFKQLLQEIEQVQEYVWLQNSQNPP